MHTVLESSECGLQKYLQITRGFTHNFEYQSEPRHQLHVVMEFLTFIPIHSRISVMTSCLLHTLCCYDRVCSGCHISVWLIWFTSLQYWILRPMTTPACICYYNPSCQMHSSFKGWKKRSTRLFCPTYTASRIFG